jgi:AraC-like DNA-binding protein
MGADRIELGPGSLLWLAPGQDHTLLSVSDDLAMWVASFRVDAVREAEKSVGFRLIDRPVCWDTCVLPAMRIQEISALHADLVHLEEPREVNPLARRMLTRALASLQEHQKTGLPESARGCIQPRPLHPAVTRARTLLREPGNEWSLESLSRRCGLGAPRLSRLFKQQMGLSVVQFRNHFRVQEFIARFGRGEQRNMLGVALESGFGSYPQFYRAFHQVTGYSPSEHLRRVRSGIVVPTHQSLQRVEGHVGFQ